MITRSQAGYDNRLSAQIQLGHLLKLSNEQFTEVKESIRSLTLTLLNIDRPGQDQNKELSTVVKQRKFPAILNTEKKLVFTRQLAMQFHRQARRTMLGNRGRNREKPASQQCERVADATLGGYSKISRACKQELEPKIEPLTFQDPITNTEGQGTKIGNSSISPSNRMRPTDKFKPTVSGDSATTTSSSATHVGTGIPSVHDFLRNCSPSMDHLLYRLVDLGFKSPDILQAVADNWTADERRDLLKRLSPSSNNEGVSELELATLEKGFYAIRSKLIR